MSIKQKLKLTIPENGLKLRLFLTCWILFSLHFATNVVREHYPAFTIAESGTFKVDKYQGFHPDIFRHIDGHSYIGNNVAGSVIAALPLFIFDPVLDVLEEYGKQKTKEALTEGNLKTAYETKYPNRREFFKLAKTEGLHLRLGAATVITSVFLMAPLSALFVVFIFLILVKRGVNTRRALWLAFLFGFATPIFFRTGHLNHNMFIMYVVFVAFYLLWTQEKENELPSLNRRLGAGFLGGVGLALDYSGVIPLLALYGYLFFSRYTITSFKQAFQESMPYILGAVPPVLFLLYSQWAMYGNPFLPGQYWMPEVTYTERGWRGFDWPSLDLFFLNLFDPAYGMFMFGPLLIVGFIPVKYYESNQLILPQRERRFVWIYVLMFLTFCAANQYSRMQFNTGIRYLVPLVPFIYLAACDHLQRMPRKYLVVLSIAMLLHSWVISMVRESVPVSWEKFLEEGIQLRWLTVIKLTHSVKHPLIYSPIFPLLILTFCGLIVFTIWKINLRSRIRPY